MPYRITFPTGEIAEFADDAPLELIEGVKSAYNRFGSLAAVDQWRQLESLRTDEGFLSLPRIERHKIFNKLALGSTDFWGTMTPDKRRLFRDAVVEAPGSNAKDAYSYWEAPIMFRDQARTGTDSAIQEFLFAMERATPHVLAGTAAGLTTIADEAVKAGGSILSGAAEKYLAPIFDLKRQYAAAGGVGPKDTESGLSGLAKQAREIATDASIGAETLAPSPRVDRLGKVHGWDDFTMYVAQALGSQVPVLGTMAAAGMIPGIGTGLVFATGAGLESGAILDDMARNGITGEKANQTAALYGGLAGLLEAAPIASFLKRTPGISKTFGAALVQRLAEVPVQAIAEGTTEFFQTLVEQTAVDIAQAERGALEEVSWLTPEGRRSLWDEALEAMAQGGIVGGALGGLGAAVRGPEIDAAAQIRDVENRVFQTGQLPGAAPAGEPVPGVLPTGPQPGTVPTTPGEEDLFTTEPTGAAPVETVEPTPTAGPGELATATESMFGAEPTEPIKAPPLVETEAAAILEERAQKPEETRAWFNPISGRPGMGWAIFNPSQGLQSDAAQDRAVFVEDIRDDGTAVVRDQDGGVDVVPVFDEAGRPNIFAPNSEQGAEYLRQLSAARSRSGLDVFAEEQGYNAIFNEAGLDRESQRQELEIPDENAYQAAVEEHERLAVARNQVQRFYPWREDEETGKLFLPDEFKGISPRYFQKQSTPREKRMGLDQYAASVEGVAPGLLSQIAKSQSGFELGEIDALVQLIKGANPKPRRAEFAAGPASKSESTYGTFYKGGWSEGDVAPAPAAAPEAEPQTMADMSEAQLEREVPLDSLPEETPPFEMGGLFDDQEAGVTQQGRQAPAGEAVSPLFGGPQEAAPTEGTLKPQGKITQKIANVVKLSNQKIEESAVKAVRDVVMANPDALEEVTHPDGGVAGYRITADGVTVQFQGHKRGDQMLLVPTQFQVEGSDTWQDVNAKPAVVSKAMRKWAEGTQKSTAPSLAFDRETARRVEPEEAASRQAEDRGASPEEDAAVIADPDGQLRMFDTATLEGIAEQVKKNVEIRISHLKSAFKGWEIKRTAGGAIEMRLRGGPPLRIEFHDDLLGERLAAVGEDIQTFIENVGRNYGWTQEQKDEYAAKVATRTARINGQYVASINDVHLITLNRPSAGPKTLFHESFHFLFRNYLRPSQRETLIEEYGNEEGAARAYADLAVERFEKLEKMTKGERILYEMYEFARQMLKYIAGDPQMSADIMEAIYSGQVWKQPFLGVAALDSVTSPGGRMRLFPGDVFGEAQPMRIAAEIGSAVQFEDGTFLKTQLSRENFMAEIGKIAKDYLPRTLGGRFYSRLAEVVQGSKQQKWKAGELLKWLKKQPGVKEEEIFWTGLEEWLTGQDSVTLDDVKLYLENNGVQVEETVREGQESKWGDRSLVLPGGKNYRELTLTLPGRVPPPDQAKRLQELFKKSGTVEGLTQAEQAEQEKLMAAPPEEPSGYTSHAFPEKNIIAWIRFNERTDADGKRVLFIEEIQSDWHQEGAKKGYLPSDPLVGITFEEATVGELLETENKALAEIAMNDRGLKKDAVVHIASDSSGRAWIGYKGEEELRRYVAGRIQNEHGVDAVPDAPFKGNAWVELSMKRMVLWAVENGFDRVAWTTGEQQAERYDLSKQVSSIDYADSGLGESYRYAVKVRDKNGEYIWSSMGTTAKELEGVIGKELTQKIVNGEGHEPGAPEGSGKLGGLDLKVGGEGKKNFYDRMLRNVASKMLKQFKGQVDVQELGTRFEQGSFKTKIEFNQDPAGLWAWRDAAGNPNADWQTGFETKETAQADADKYKTDELGLSGQMGFDITPAVREGHLLGAPLFELEGDLNNPVQRVPDDPETMFQPDVQSPPDGFHSPGLVLERNLVKEWFREHIIRNLFEKLEPLRHLQETLTEQGLKIHDSLNAYLKARNFSARAGATLDWLQSNMFQPFVDKLAALNMELVQFDEMRMAIHALEANPLMYRLNVVVPRTALLKRIEKLEKAGLRKGMNVRVPGTAGLVGKVAKVDKETGKVVIEWLDRDEGRNRAKEFAADEVQRDAVAEAKQKLKEVDDMVAADEVPHCGMSTELARQVLRESRDAGLIQFDGEPMRKTEYKGKFMEASRLFDRIVRWKEETLVRSGLLSQEELDRWRKDYKYYTPMRGKQPDILDWIFGGDRPPIPEIENYGGSMWLRAVDAVARASGHEGEVHRPNTGKGYNPGARKPSRRRLGRHSMPTHSPTVELMADAMEVAVRAEKNRVAKTVWNLFKSLEHVEDAEGKPLFVFDTPPTKRYYHEKSGEVRERPDTLALRKPNVYDIWIDGEHHYVWSGSKELAGLFSVLNNIGPESAPQVLRGAAAINRYIAKMATSRNPAFAIPNAVRDFLTAAIRVTTTHKELGTEILKKIPASAKKIAEYNRLQSLGRLNEMDQTDRKRIEKWKRAGGETAFWMIPRLNVQAKNLKKELRKAGGRESRVMAWGRTVIDFLEDYNGALEGAARFSAFERALEIGSTLDQAALVSREITVDFTRQGEWAGWLGSLYVFSNASLQGSRMVYDTLKTPTGKKWFMGLVSLGVMAGMAGRVAGGDDPEDETAYWDKVTAYEKSRNLILMIPGSDGKRLKIPLPWGFNVPVMIGQMVADAALSDKVSSFESAANIMSSAVSAFNPIGDGDLKETTGWWQMLAPSWADPAVDVAFNRTFWGGPIMPERSSYKKSEQYGIPSKDHMRYFSSVSALSKEFTKGLYKLTGEQVSISPETVDYMVAAVFGGLGDVVQKTINLVPAMSQRHALAAHELPVVRSFYADESQFYAPQMYRENMAHHWLHYEELRELKKSNPQEAASYERRWAHILTLHDQVKSIEERVSELRKAGVETSDARLQRIYKNFNRMYDRVEANRRRALKQEPSIMKQ